ncbi:hypothetical protein Saso_48240 [Streptomyces asoensis]|uniref:Uncharacterized protein n=1 Tax=Streptomyces asoensis TaxID=249586 RepID=A0ABQ3S4W6_9ACTN|nr:hypothetical protein GCM10010496_31450 [Streptomyces asoensis]GHI63174.1 hypothetical protein Saso_48240 [Streptomyces asoensis]
MKSDDPRVGRRSRRQSGRGSERSTPGRAVWSAVRGCVPKALSGEDFGDQVVLVRSQVHDPVSESHTLTGALKPVPVEVNVHSAE